MIHKHYSPGAMSGPQSILTSSAGRQQSPPPTRPYSEEPPEPLEPGVRPRPGSAGLQAPDDELARLRALLRQRDRQIRALRSELEHLRLLAGRPEPAAAAADTDNSDRDTDQEAHTDDDERLAEQRHDIEPDDDQHILPTGLLTSLTDAAICNLSQLAALQERSESQRRPPASSSSSTPTGREPDEASLRSAFAMAGQPPVGSPDSSCCASASLSLHTPTISATNSASQTPDLTLPASHMPTSLASVVAAAALSQPLHQHASQQPHQQQQQHQPHQQQHQQQQQQQPHQQHQNHNHNHNHNQQPQANPTLTSALQQQHQAAGHPLITPTLSSPDFYLRHALDAEGPPLLGRNVFSPPPSPSSLMAAAVASAGQRSRSAAGHDEPLMSPIASPSYLRRHLLMEQLSMLSPSPTTSGLGTASSASNASPALSHYLHLSQRSASALSGPLAGSPLSSAGSLSAVSPMMSTKSAAPARLNNMQIRNKFGYLGNGRAQFNSPHGFCLGLAQEIVVADTNNHRVCVFDKDGTFISQFGSPGKDEGQLWNPRKVAILQRPAGEPPTHKRAISLPQEPLYVVCDRGPDRSRMQLFTKEGQFVKKIGIHYIDIVAGLAVGQSGLIVVVDSVSPTVYIIDVDTGSLNNWFDCSGHMKEPSDIAVKADAASSEYFICDFKGHCVVVFSEHGEYLRKIGHDGLTSYPNGIDISDEGDILVGDSHGNRFHVVVFDRNGNFVSQFECPHVKVSRCCGLKITREGYIVTLAKNNHHVLVLDTIHI